MKKIKAYFVGGIISSNEAEAIALYEKSCFGEPEKERIIYSLYEALFLIEKNKIEVYSFQNKKISEKDFLKKSQRIDKKFMIKYRVFRDLREKGHIVKTALKFGAEFRVYEKGARPGKKHAKWIVFTDHEAGKVTWHEFAAKNRVAHSTRKKLLLAIVDEEGDVSYYEVGWIRP